jgi:hypothetical protein
MLATKRAKPRTPTQCAAPYPSTRPRASQSLAEPSASANASTISPIASVRGSNQAEPSDGTDPVWSGDPDGNALECRTVAVTAAAGTTRKCTGRGRPTPAASAPRPAPLNVPRLQPAWNRAMMLRPRRRSTTAPSTFMATSQMPEPKPFTPSPRAANGTDPSAAPTPAVTSPASTVAALRRTTASAPNRSIR